MVKKNKKSILCTYYGGTAFSNESKFKCLKDGYEWSGKVSNIKSGKGCPVCSKVKKVKDIEEVNQWLNDHHRNIICIQYCGNLREHSTFQCNICHRTWSTNFNSVKRGTSCPHCSSSKGEQNIGNILDLHKIQYKPQYWFDDCRMQLPLPFDFAIFKDGKIIALCEYQGEQHYRPVDFANKGQEWAEKQFKRNQKSDNIKRKYCEKNNIPLLEIPYWEYQNTEILLLNFIKEVA